MSAPQSSTPFCGDIPIDFLYVTATANDGEAQWFYPFLGNCGCSRYITKKESYREQSWINDKCYDLDKKSSGLCDSTINHKINNFINGEGEIKSTNETILVGSASSINGCGGGCSCSANYKIKNAPLLAHPWCCGERTGDGKCRCTNAKGRVIISPYGGLCGSPCTDQQTTCTKMEGTDCSHIYKNAEGKIIGAIGGYTKITLGEEKSLDKIYQELITPSVNKQIQRLKGDLSKFMKKQAKTDTFYFNGPDIKEGNCTAYNRQYLFRLKLSEPCSTCSPTPIIYEKITGQIIFYTLNPARNGIAQYDYRVGYITPCSPCYSLTDPEVEPFDGDAKKTIDFTIGPSKVSGDLFLNSSDFNEEVTLRYCLKVTEVVVRKPKK